MLSLQPQIKTIFVGEWFQTDDVLSVN